MPIAKKAINASAKIAPKTDRRTEPAPNISTRDSRIRRSRLEQSAAPDARDVDAGSTHALNVTHAPEAKQALAFRPRIAALAVVDGASHTKLLEDVKTAKQIDRAIDEHWKKITRGLDAFKDSLLKMKAADRAPALEFIAAASKVCLDYENAEKARIAAAEEVTRKEAEERARKQREQELADADAQALRLEAESQNLSARELWFVTKFVEAIPQIGDFVIVGQEKVLEQACAAAGYKNPAAQVDKLLNSEKILDAIEAAREALVIREQQTALRDQPLDIVVPETAPSNGLGYVPRMASRFTYSCVVDDPQKLRDALKDGSLTNELALVPDQVFLNGEARNIKDPAIFAAAFPGCRIVKKQGLAG